MYLRLDNFRNFKFLNSVYGTSVRRTSYVNVYVDNRIGMLIFNKWNKCLIN